MKVESKSLSMLNAVFREALISLHANKLRSFLTMLGIIIGVCAVVIMVAAGQTVQNMINDSLSGIGSNLLIIRPEYTTSAGVRGSGMTVIKVQDADAIRSNKYLRAVSPIVNGSGQIVYKNENYMVQIQAGTPDIMRTGNYEIEEGEPITGRDVRSGTAVVLIGQTLKTELFHGADPIGEVVRIRNVPFVVKGLLKAKGQGIGGQDQDAAVIMPITTYRRRIQGSWIPNRVNYIMAQVDAEQNIEKAKLLIEAALRETRRIKPSAENDFRIDDMTEMLNTIRDVGRYLSILLASIASISLVVGSIGIM
ncbi:MAG: ABC transporter permease, partial [Rickettsiales bacterium]|nr:ABC transporter permease [Rickettsiales bacterium]